MAKKSRAERPTKSTEFEIVFATREAERGWQDVRATQRNALADAWDALSRHPLDRTPTMHPLRGELGVIVHAGASHERWQYELTGGARIWYFVEERSVYLEQVHTRHPNQTK
ncbi:hypothetical protein ACTJI8_14630 [Microbacterium sp. 22303]|uniref:hypothetical protein n=1 Tax=Microbacterium sp. 22303 TaxID=3453905 RepID=UPI003F8297BC